MNELEISESIEKIDDYIIQKLPVKRYNHSIRVAKMASNLCKSFSVNPNLGYLVGIAHDMCKDEKDKFLLKMAIKDKNPISDIEYSKPSLLHGRVAAIMLKKEFGISNKSVLNAVASHTLGSPDMDKLGKILYVADKIEPGRKEVDKGFRNKVLLESLDNMVVLVIENNISYLKARGKRISPITEITLINFKME